VSTPAPSLLPTPSTTFADRFWALAPGPATTDVPEPLHTIVIVRHFLAVLDELQKGPRKLVPALGAMLRSAEVDGCVSYASPEQLNGEPLDTRSVVFSLGVVLFEKLAGRHPFGAENNRPRRITRIQRGEMGSGVNSFPTIAGSVRSVLVRAMNPFPEERWPDLRPMRDLLSQFLTSDQAPPRLPGTSAADTDLPAESTRVVRRATDFGRELMDVVAKHDRPESTPRPLRPATWQGEASHPRSKRTTPSPPPTPRMGVSVLRPPAPKTLVPALDETSTSDSAITRIDPARIDPLAATIRVKMPQLDAANDDGVEDSQASITAPLAPHEIVAETKSASPTITATVRPLSEAVPDLRVASRSKTLVVAAASAAIGAGIATIAVFALRKDPVRIAPPAPASIATAVTALDEIEAATPPPTPAPAPAPAPAAEAPAPPAVVVDDFTARVQSALAPCFAQPQTGTRVDAITVVPKGAGARPYFATNTLLTPAEKGCMISALKLVANAPTESVFRIHVDASGAALTLRK
jgi:serine/threonine protein kinase